MHIYPQFHSNRCPKVGEQAARTQKPHRGFVLYRAVLACNANAVMRRVMRKQRCKCCVLFQSECLHGAFGTRKRASIKITQHPWRCFRAHSVDRVASLRSATLPCKQRNRDAVCCSKRFCLSFLFIAWVKNNNKYSSINYPLFLQYPLRGRTSRASLHASCLQIIF